MNDNELRAVECVCGVLMVAIVMAFLYFITKDN